MERLSNLFFELSHEDRLMILSSLSKQPMKLTHIAAKLDDSSQEVYRHLSRLVDAGLVAKSPDGDYVVTAYGLQVMKLMPGYEFLVEHSDYFMNRDLSLLPEKFVSRIGELVEAVFVNDVMVTLFDTGVMIREAEEYICIMTDQMVMNQYQPLIDATDRGVLVKMMRPPGWQLPDDIAERIGRDTIREAIERIKEGKIAQREPKTLPMFLAFSEKQVAAVSFAKQGGDLDYLGFKSGEENVRGWCRDLFDYMWERAQVGEIRTKID
jgi:predicted transcriptional regulator